jgi:hypothetical protein
LNLFENLLTAEMLPAATPLESRILLRAKPDSRTLPRALPRALPH